MYIITVIVVIANQLSYVAPPYRLCYMLCSVMFNNGNQWLEPWLAFDRHGPVFSKNQRSKPEILHLNVSEN